MNLKKLYLSTAVLVIAAGITYKLNQPGDLAKQDPRVGSTLVTNEALDSVTTLEMISGTESMTFEFDPSEKLWTLQEQYGLPADSKKISDLIKKLKETNLERVASSNPERIADFGFGVDSINLNTADGSSVLSLDLGRETDTGKQLVRFGDEDIAFIASDTFSVDGDPTSWLDKKILEFARQDIRSATFELANGETLSVSRESDNEDWTTESDLPEGKQLDQGAITRALNRFASVSFTDIPALEDPAMSGPTPQRISLSISLQNGTGYNVALSRTPEVKELNEIETTNDAGETVTETKEEIKTPAGPVLFNVVSSDPDDRSALFGDRSYEVGSFLYTSMPKVLDELLADIPTSEEETSEQ